MDKTVKTGIIQRFQADEKDTGSTEVQVALITSRIVRLTEHLGVHRHDHHTRRGLLQLVGQRRRLLVYLGRRDVKRYRELIKQLALRK